MADDSLLTYPVWTVAGTGVVGPVGTSSKSLTAWTATATGLTGHVGTSEVTLWWLSAAGMADESVEIPLWLADGSGNPGMLGDSTADWAMWVATGTGQAGQTRTGESDATFRPWVSRGQGLTGTVGSSYVTFPAVEAANSEGGQSATGQSTVTLPLWLSEGLGSEAISATIIVGLGGEGIALNTRLLRMTAIQGWAFNSMIELNGEVLGATSTGLFVVDGDTDDGAAIAAIATTGAHDFGSDKIKRAGTLYVGYRADGDLRVRFIVDEHDDAEYVMEQPGHETLSTERVKVGKGLVGRWWQLEVTNIGGADFELDSMSLDLDDLSRRIA